MSIRRIEQKAMTGLRRPVIYAYMILHIWVKYTIELVTFKICPLEYVKFLVRLLRMALALYPNKIMKIDGKYKYQLYLPAFPGKPFFHAMKKFDPRTKTPGPITVVFSMTKACPYKCPHCYQRNDKGTDLEMGLLKKTAREMQEIGVSMFDIEGGEPLIQFERLMDILSAFDERAELWVNTTGYRLTEEKAERMKRAGVYGVMVSIHSADKETYDKFTGVDGSFETAKKAIRIFQKYGIVTAINFCPTADDILEGGVGRLMELSKELNVSLVQVIHAKPSGGWLDKPDAIYDSSELMEKLYEYHEYYNHSAVADQYPSILFQVFEEDEKSFGCTAGGIDRFYLNHEGEVQPCEFVNVSFGNVKEEPFVEIFSRMRSYFQKPGTKWPCCSEAHTISEAVKKYNLEKTPVPWEITEKLVSKWDMGDETPIYKKLGIYKK